MKRPFVQFPVDGPEEGEEPDEWDMEIERPDDFVDKVIRKGPSTKEIHSRFLKP